MKVLKMRKIHSKQLIPEYIYYFLLFVSILLFLVAKGYAVAIDDEVDLWNLLISGESGTLMLSYPFSYILGQLYNYFPAVQWYSLFIVFIVILNIYIVSVFLGKLKSKFNKVILFILTSLMLTYSLMPFTITSLTVLTMAVAFLLLEKHFALFLGMILFATFLRTNIAIFLIPFVVTGALLLRKKFIIKVEFFWLLLFVGILSVNILSSKLDFEYTNWLKYNDSGGAFIDFDGKDSREILSPDEKILVNNWYLQDNDLLSTDKIIKAAPSLFDILQQKLPDVKINKFINHKHKYILIFLILSTIFLLIQKRNLKSLIFYTFFTLGVFLLLILKDVNRVTVPIFIMWFIILLLDFFNRNNKNQTKFFISVYLLISIYYFYPILTPRKNAIIKSWDLKKEALSLVRESGISCESSYSFPAGWNKNTSKVFRDWPLFNESHWVKYSDGYFLPAGILCRHRYFYETHNISTPLVQRKYQNYHEYLLDEKTGFIGDKNLVDNKLSKTILKRYDELFLDNDEYFICHHKAVIVKESEHFSISQVKIICK